MEQSNQSKDEQIQILNKELNSLKLYVTKFEEVCKKKKVYKDASKRYEDRIREIEKAIEEKQRIITDKNS